MKHTRTSQIPNTKKHGILPDVAAADINDLILRDHEPLKAAIETLKDADISRAEKESVYEEFVPKLLAHAKAEEQTLYVAMKEHQSLKIEGLEGDTEHAIVDELVQEINRTPNDDEWTARVKVLAESLEHHIEEEETEMLQDVEKTIGTEERMELGAEYSRIKAECDALLTSAEPHEATNRATGPVKNNPLKH